jgi:hypothetical protein
MLFDETPPKYETHYIRDLAIRFLAEAERDDERPWLLFITSKSPHAPQTPEPKYDDATVPAFTPLPSYFENIDDKPDYLRWRQTSPATTADLVREQLQTLMSVDDMVDRVMRELRRRGEERDTIAFFVSDNGHMWGEHGLGTKGLPYTENIKIPFLMRWPSHTRLVRRGSTDQRFVSNIDVAPTALDATDVTPAEGSPPMDGISLLDRGRQRSRIFTEYWRNGDFNIGVTPPFASLRTRTYQYIEYYTIDGTTPLTWSDGTPVREYYDLTNDPYQMTNLLHDGNAGNDPSLTSIQNQLQRERLCEGESCHPGTQQPPASDQTPPITELLTLPHSGALTGGPFYLLAQAHDNFGVAGVQFKVDGQNLGPEDSTLVYESSWNTTSLPDGPHTLSVQARDGSGNIGSSSYAFTVDNSSPRGVDVQTCVAPAPCGPTPGSAENGDTLTYRFSTAMDPASIVAGWNGAARPATLRINSDAPAAGYDDTVTIDGVPALGTIDLGLQTYTSDHMDPNVYSGSTMQMSADRTEVIVTLGGGFASAPGNSKQNASWQPGPGMRSATGVPACACYVTETGVLDREF